MNNIETVQLVINHLKGFQSKRNAIKKDMQLNLSKIVKDINACQNFQNNKLFFESIKVENEEENYSNDQVSHIKEYLENMHKQLEKFYQNAIISIDKANEDYKQELKSRDLQTFHQVAKVMLDCGF